MAHFRSYRSAMKNIIKMKRGWSYEFAINLSFSLRFLTQKKNGVWIDQVIVIGL